MHRVVHHARPVRWKRATAGLPEGGTEQLTDALHIFPSTCLRLFSILIRTEGRQFNTAAGLPESSWDVLCAAFHVDNFATILTCAEVCPAPRVSIAAAGCKGCVRCGLKACARHRLLIIARSCCKLSTNIPNLLYLHSPEVMTRLHASGCSPCSRRSLEKRHCQSSRGRQFPSCERNNIKSGLLERGCSLHVGS